MVYQKNQKGVSLITLVITIVVIIILALITLGANNNSIEEAAAVKFKQELAEVKRGVETVKLINSKDGLDEATLNKNFKKVEVKEAPDNFVSFDEGRNTAYLVDLEEIDYKKVKTGQKYKEIDEGGTVTFGVDDVYVYDREGTVYYVKGTYLEGKENIYTTEEKRTEGPIVSAQNTERGIIQIKVTPTNGGVITSVTVDGIEATKISDGLYEIEVSKNGTYKVIGTQKVEKEKGTETKSAATNVTVRKIVKEDADPIPTPAAGTIIINNGEMYATDEKAIVKINSDAELMYLKHVTTGSAPIVPTSESLGWTRVLSEKTIYLSEGKNDIWVWFRNEGNNTFPYDKKSIILDTTPPTDTRPTVEENADGSLTVKSNQIDMGSGLKKVDIGYKLLSDTEYKKIEVSDLTNLTEKITGIIEGEVYSVITIAEDNVGLVSTSKETIVGSIKEIPNDIKITYSPTKGWTKRSEAIITYPIQSNNSLYQRWYRVNNEPWQSVNSMEETLNFDEKVEIEAVVVKVVNSTTVLGEIEKVVINNIDNTKPIIGEITFEAADGISEADYKAKTILEDSESGIRYYAITNSEADPTSWSELDTAVKSKEITFDANIGNTYYVWAKDDVGNVNYKGVKPEGKDFTAPNITVKLDRTEFEYTGLEIRPEVIVKDSGDLLKNETHYRLVYEENVNAGTGKIYVIGIVPYVGTREITFTITKATPIIEIKDISYKYDATIKEIEEAVVLGTENGDVPSGEITYIYYKDISLTTKTSISDGATIDGGAPKNVGTYYVVANIAEAGNYKAATSNTAILGIQERDVKVLFDANGGTIAESERTVYYGKIYGTMPEATKDGYKLEGWYTENNEKVEADTIVNNLYEHTLYAKWYGAQAIYTEGNQTLTFVKREAIAVGDTFSGETVTEVYTGFEEDAYIYASYVPWNDYALNIEKVVVKDTISPVSTAWWFWSMRNAVSIDVAKLNTTNVRDMSWMFHEAGYNTTTFEIIGLNNWNTSNVNTMSRMFNFAGYKVDEFEISGLNNWDTTNVTDMSYMFSHTGYNSQTWKIEDLSNWNTLNVTNMEFMFDYSGYMAKNYELVGINKWDTRSVRNMSYMFNCAGQFANTWTIGKLDNWNTSNVTNFKYMFCLAGDSATTWDIGNLSKKTITKEDGTTYTAWNTYNATDMSYMFQSAGSNATTWTIGDIGNWNVSKVTNMTRMLSGIGYNVNTFTMDLGSWDTSSVTSMSEMFYSTGHNAKTFELKGLNNWDTSNVTSMSSMFWNLGYSSNGFSLDLSGWNTSNITDMSYMFHNGERLINLNISGWNTSNVTSSSGMFNNCNRLEEITVGTGFTLASLLPTPSSTYITGADGNWYNKATGAEYTPATIPSGEAATYTAIDPKITITFDANGGQITEDNAATATREVTYGSTYGEAGNGLGMPSATRDGHTFLGWYTAASEGIQVTESTSVTATSDHTLYAHWEKETACDECNGTGLVTCENGLALCSSVYSHINTYTCYHTNVQAKTYRCSYTSDCSGTGLGNGYKCLDCGSVRSDRCALHTGLYGIAPDPAPVLMKCTHCQGSGFVAVLCEEHQEYGSHQIPCSKCSQ